MPKLGLRLAAPRNPSLDRTKRASGTETAPTTLTCEREERGELRAVKAGDRVRLGCEIRQEGGCALVYGREGREDCVHARLTESERTAAHVPAAPKQHTWRPVGRRRVGPWAPNMSDGSSRSGGGSRPAQRLQWQRPSRGRAGAAERRRADEERRPGQ